MLVALFLAGAALTPTSCNPPPTTTTTTVPLAFDVDCAGGTHDTITLSDVSGVRIVNCHFLTDAFVQLTNVSNALIDHDTFTADTDAVASIQINHHGGSHVTITNNTLYGAGAAIGCCFVGEDDGIVLQNVDHDTVNANVVDQYWDCGIETLGAIQDTSISGNTITNARTCGIGGWLAADGIPSSWLSDTIANNHVSSSGQMFRFFNETGTWTNNSFTGNVASSLTTTGAASIFDASASPAASGNVVSTNDFDASRFAPTFLPNTAAAWTGTGNTCGARSQSGGSAPCPG